jgi:putative dimethyl sulfoxide reductase chaperone
MEYRLISSDQINLLKGYNMLLYFAGSMIMSEPTEECVIDFWAKGTLKNLPVSSKNPRFIKAASLLRNSCDEKETCRIRLADDFYRLFAKTGLPLAPPRASIYLDRQNKELNNDLSISDFYSSYGWHLKPRGKEYDDHLGIELLFLTKLIDKYMTMDDDPSCREMKKEIRKYIEVHLLTWIPKWNEDIQEYAHTYCYKGIGTLIYASLEDLYRIFDTRNKTTIQI